MCKEIVPVKKCDLFCHQGRCQITPLGPKCICNQFYEGEFCERYRCSQYCKNGGQYYVTAQN